MNKAPAKAKKVPMAIDLKGKLIWFLKNLKPIFKHSILTIFIINKNITSVGIITSFLADFNIEVKLIWAKS